MGLLMDDALGIGLAATQVGVLHRLLVYRVQTGAPLAALANPVIEWSSKEEEIAEEGCLSLPSVHVEVERPVHIRVSAQDEYGEPILIEASGLEARVIQHEMDHLDGVLILDRTPRDQRKDAMRILREWQEQQQHRVRTVYLGTSEFAGAVLRRLHDSPHRPALVVSRPDSPQGRGRKLTPPPTIDGRARARHRDLPAGSRQHRRGARADRRRPSPRRWSCARSAR